MPGLYNTDILASVIAQAETRSSNKNTLLPLFSAAVVTADHLILSDIIALCEKHQLSYHTLYELVLQSYLFLGFPRMLIASEALTQTYKNKQTPPQTETFDYTAFMKRGEKLCREVYGSFYEPLREKLHASAPEVFEWMLLEGYGKVLSRPHLPIGQREISIITFLLMENRYKQLYSHILGAMKVGVDKAEVDELVGQFKEIAPDGYASGKKILAELRKQ